MTQAKVVLVEDDKSPLVAVKDALKRAGFEVTSCGGTFDAIKELNSHGADIVVSSTKLSDLSGYQLACLIKCNDRSSQLPVVLVNADGDGVDAFWSSAALADSILSLKDLKGGDDKLVGLVTDLVGKSREQGWKPNMLKDSGLVSASVTGKDPLASYGQLVTDLLIERLVGRLARSMMEIVEPRKKFLDNYFSIISRLFNCQVVGLTLGSTTAPWASFQVAPGLSKKAFDDLISKVRKQMETHKDLTVEVRGSLQENGGKAINTPEILAIKGDKGSLGTLVFAAQDKKGFDQTGRLAMAQLQIQIQPVMRILLANQEIETLYHREQYRASTDPLTGLYNLEFLVGFLQQQLLFSYRQRSPVGLVIIDIDGFKAINDEYGYEIGDAVLSSIANRLLNQTRSSDLIARYGGDEFAVVLPNTDANGAKVLAEKVRLEVEQMSFVKGPGRKGPRVTVSIGCASFNMEDLNPETILRDGKMALQRAKEGGRNRVSA